LIERRKSNLTKIWPHHSNSVLTTNNPDIDFEGCGLEGFNPEMGHWSPVAFQTMVTFTPSIAGPGASAVQRRITQCHALAFCERLTEGLIPSDNDIAPT
jgi:hypothetical protein